MAELEPAYVGITRAAVQLNDWIPWDPTKIPAPSVAD